MLQVLELVIGITLWTLFITQWVVPRLRGTKTFPYFRSREPELHEQLRDINQTIEEQEFESVIEERRQRIRQAKGKETPQ